ncbi:MAG: nucleotide exchange factor GrpE [Rhodospirillaceae bacterium]|nr:nucleotide exchange factor GrpE [Rhodospirillaceae bacterium]|tara:strand:- start:564 stop:1220 length:657 start_codon:yes stop_codon:yes gene_type:complete
MTSSTDNTEPTNSGSVKDDLTQGDRTGESQATDNNASNANSIENEAPPEPSDGTDEGPVEPEEEDLRNQFLRVMADNENLRKRTEREVAAAKKYGPLSFARDLLSSIDNLEKAIALIPENKSEMDETLKNILIGVDMTGREVASVFERHGISKIDPSGEKFDYNLHQAMFEVPTDEVEPGTVVQVVQLGYLLHDRLLRPAMVGVSKAAQPESSESVED